MDVAHKPRLNVPAAERLKALAPGLALATGVTVLAYVLRAVTASRW